MVVYLRSLYYPEGFHFPTVLVPHKILVAELLREICTIVMLLSLSLIAGKNRLQILSYFLFSFAVWDIFYYLGLKWFLNWPSSFFTWDILFLIPVTWLGPVLAPLICSLSMICISLIFLFLKRQKPDFRIKKIEWLFIGLGSFLIFVTFIWDYASLIVKNRLIGSSLSLMKNQTFREISSQYIPTQYNWCLFIIGLLSIYFSVFLILIKNINRKQEA